MTGSTVDEAVDRFLWWPLAASFAPDAGISFTPFPGPHSWPVGTNLFTAIEAKAMFEHCLPPEQKLVHQGVDLCEVAAAVEVVRALDHVKAVNSIVAGFHEGPFRAGFEQACEEIAHRLRADVTQKQGTLPL